MHLITVSFGTTACPLLFKTEESAKAAWEQLMPAFQNTGGAEQLTTMESIRKNIPAISAHHVLINDDFGRSLYLPGAIAGAVFEDLDVSKEGQIEQALHNARTQAKAQQRSQTDPVLTSAQRGFQQGPAILSPMGGNGRGF